MNKLVFLLIPLILGGNVVSVAYSYIPPTDAYDQFNTTNDTVKAPHYEMSVNMKGLGGIIVKGSHASQTIYIDGSGVSGKPPTTYCPPNYGFVSYNATTNIITCGLLNQTGTNGITLVNNQAGPHINIVRGTNVNSITNNSNTIKINVAGWQNNTGQNLGLHGTGFYSGMNGSVLQFFKLLVSYPFSISTNATNVILKFTAKFNNDTCLGSNTFFKQFDNVTGNFICGSVSGFLTSAILSINSDTTANQVLKAGQGVSITDYNNGTHKISTNFKVNNVSCASGFFVTNFSNSTGSYTCTPVSYSSGVVFKSLTVSCSSGNAVTSFDNTTGIYTCSAVTSTFNGKNGMIVLQGTANHISVTEAPPKTFTVDTLFKVNNSTCSAGKAATSYDNKTGNTVCSTFSTSGLTGSGKSPYIAYWNGTSSLNQTKGLQWDSTNNVLKGLTDVVTSLGSKSLRFLNIFASVTNSTTVETNTLKASTDSIVNMTAPTFQIKGNTIQTSTYNIVEQGNTLKITNKGTTVNSGGVIIDFLANVLSSGVSLLTLDGTSPQLQLTDEASTATEGIQNFQGTLRFLNSSGLPDAKLYDNGTWKITDVNSININASKKIWQNSTRVIDTITASSPITITKSGGIEYLKCPTCSTSSLTGSGRSPYLAYWNGTSSLNQTKNLQWDSTNNVLKGLTDVITSLGTSSIKYLNIFGSVINGTTVRANTLTSSTGSIITASSSITSTGGITMSWANINLGSNQLQTSAHVYNETGLNGIDGNIPSFRSSTTNGATNVLISPNGNSKNAVLYVGRLSNLINWELLQVGSDVVGTNEFGIRSVSNDGINNAINFYMGSTKLFAITTNNRIIAYNHIEVSDTVPTVTSCGTSPSIAGNDIVGKVTIGTGIAVTSCTITFAHTWTNAPSCMTDDESSILTVQASTSTTVLTLTTASGVGGNVIKYICLGYS